MNVGRVLGTGAVLLLTAAGGAAYLSYRSGMAQAEAAWRELAAQARPAKVAFDPAMLAGQPEIAQRYFGHAIAPGTRLAATVELEMRGTFLLGDKVRHQTYAMQARQLLRPPYEFVWIPKLRSGPVTITGSDALVGGRGWTRFWLMHLVPVAKVETSTDLVRSAAFRAATEGLWLPASLLPRNGAEWTQTGPDTARVTITRVDPPVTLELRLAANGAVQEVVGQRWSNANAEKRFQLQPFGGTVAGEATFGGYTIPAQLNVGNHYGTDEYLPFFQAEVVSARFL
jgi:hypothetical protein